MAWFNFWRKKFASKTGDPVEEKDNEFADRMRECWDAIQGQDTSRAMALVEEVLSHASQWCQQEMTEDFRLKLVASNCEQQHDWDAAEAVYREILQLPDLETIGRGDIHNWLGWLHTIRGRLPEALAEYRQATFYAQQDDLPLCTAIALRREIHCLTELGDFDEATALLEEATEITASDPAFQQIHAEMLILRARVRLYVQQSDQTEAALLEADQMLAAYATMPFLRGAQCVRARWFAARGELRSATGDHSGAVEDCQRAVDLTRRVIDSDDDQVCQVQLCLHLEQLATAWRAVGDLTEAHAAEQESRYLRNLLKLPRPTDSAEAAN